jgi:8-oxo-dGTP pyrophosphatase MutT (NUDIX family)
MSHPYNPEVLYIPTEKTRLARIKNHVNTNYNKPEYKDNFDNFVDNYTNSYADASITHGLTAESPLVQVQSVLGGVYYDAYDTYLKPLDEYKKSQYKAGIIVYTTSPRYRTIKIANYDNTGIGNHKVYWPKGTIERKPDGQLEYPLEAALREFHEETGVNLLEQGIHIDRFIPLRVANMHINGNRIHPKLADSRDTHLIQQIGPLQNKPTHWFKLELNDEEYDKIVGLIESKKDDITVAPEGTVFWKNKYIKYKNKYLKLKSLLLENKLN